MRAMNWMGTIMNNIKRHIRFEYHLLDKNGQYKKRLYNVQSASVRYASLARLKGSANILMAEDNDIDYISDRIQIKCIINDKSHDLGDYLISSPKRVINGNQVMRDCQCWDKLLILDEDKVESRHVCNIGTNVINEIKRIIGDLPQAIGDDASTLNSAIEWEIGTPKLTIINDLLAIINWTGLRVNQAGFFTTDPYIIPSERQVEFNLESGADSIIHPDKTDELDLFNVPNVVILTTNNPDIDPPLKAVAENNNVDSATSIPRRGRRIVYHEEITEAIDQATINARAKKILYDKSDVYNHVTHATAIAPDEFGYLKCLYYKTPKIEGKFIQTMTEIKCEAGGKMERTMRKAVKI